MAKQETYENIDRPYNSFLERADQPGGSLPTAVQNAQSVANSGVNTPASGGGTATASVDNGSVEQTPVLNDGNMGDVWIKNFIRSINWKPKKVGFNISGQTGYAEFCNVFISGEVEAKTGLIGGFTIGSTDLSTTAGGNKTTLSSGAISFSSGPANAPTIRITQQGKIYVGASNPIIIDGVAKEIESDNYVSGAFGSGFHLDSNLFEVGNIACRGIFRTAVFQKDIINVIAGSFVVSPNGDVLDVDMTAYDNATLTTKGTTTLFVNDILRMKEVHGDNVDDEWLRVTDISNAPTYSVTRDLAGYYESNNNPTWKKGVAVVDYGQSGQGGVYMTASDNNAPYISIFEHSGSPWTSVDTKMRMGNLNGFLGYSTNLYGVAIGDSARFLKYDSTYGLRVQGSIIITNPGDIITSTLTNDTGWTDDAALTSFIGGAYTDDLAGIQDQIDGIVVNWFYEGEPTLANTPAVDWNTNELKDNHLGDLYYDLLTGYAYRFILDGTYQWYLVPDLGVIEALAAAAAAQDTADGKRRVFVVEPTTPYDVGDLWANGTFLKKCKTQKLTGPYDAANWELATNYTDDTVAEQAITDAATAQTAADTAQGAAEDAQTTADAKIQTYYQSAMPLTEYLNTPDNSTYNKLVGDMWYDTDTDQTWIYTKTANGGNFDYKFSEMTIPVSVFDTIDGKRMVFTAEPTTPYYVGDLWLTSLSATTGDLKKCVTANPSGVYNAAHWVVATKYTDDTVANTKVTTFLQNDIPTSLTVGDLWIDTNDNNKLYRAASIGANEITAGEWIEVPMVGGAKIFAQDTIPTSLAVNDLWYDTNDGNKLYKADSVGADAISVGEWVVVPTDFANINGATKPENNATVGADWDVNLGNIPTQLGTPSGTGLFLGATNMGYYTEGAWKTYMDSFGNLILGDIAGGNTGLSWNQTGGTLTIKGAITATSGSFAGSVTATTGTIGGLTLSDSALYTESKTAYNDASAGVHFGIDGIGIANNLFTVSVAGALVAKSATIGSWSVNSTSIYTGTEDHSEYTAFPGDITFFSNGTDASIHAYHFYIDQSGNITSDAGATITGGTITGGTIQTAASGIARVRLNGGNNRLEFMNAANLVRGYLTINNGEDVIMAATDDVYFWAGGAERAHVGSNGIFADQVTADTLKGNHSAADGTGGKSGTFYIGTSDNSQCTHQIKFKDGVLVDN